MTPAQIAATVEELKPRFLKGLTSAEMKAVLSAGTVKRFQANAIVTHEGSTASQIFLLLSGRARYFTMTPDGQKVLLMWLPPGEAFGGAAFLSRPEEYLVSTEVVMDCAVLMWNRTALRNLAERCPRLVENAMLLMFDYLVFYKAIHTSLICHTARQRLAQVLFNLATGIGQKVPEGIELDVRNEELANEANVTPFTTSRLLNEWQREGIVVKTRGKLLVISPRRLSMQ